MAPTGPATPARPAAPAGPAGPVRPVGPVGPVRPVGPGGPELTFLLIAPFTLFDTVVVAFCSILECSSSFSEVLLLSLASLA